MRATFFTCGLVALFAVAQADVTGEIFARQNSESAAAIVTSGAVTVTQAVSTVFTCPSESECSSSVAALSIPTSTAASTGALNALTVLSCALEPCTSSSSPPSITTTTTFLTVASSIAAALSSTQSPENAAGVLSAAEATFLPLSSSETYSFAPALYSSYGLILQSSVDSQSASSTGPSSFAPTPVGPETSSVPAITSTTETTTIPTASASGSEVSPVTASTSLSSSGTTVVPVPVTPSSSASPAESSVASPETGSSAAIIMTTSTAPSASSGTTSSGSESTANPVEGSSTASAAGSATTTPAPVAPTNAANNQEMPAAMGGLAIAAAALLFV
ncbi:hypothetical protein B0A50_00983 [Salinomyces thailandicus]|uniref:Uncharacterized protein n=1 Tax=Salinomyces thailandicus TaxID=706561 RepID=A0A4U0UBL8_9PEZI|nr:hypothetical protein B0A50_00983 [Salinomyces thailandica]